MTYHTLIAAERYSRPTVRAAKLAQWALSFGADRGLLLHRSKRSLHVTINDQLNRRQRRQIIVWSLTLSDRIRGHWRVMYCNRLALVCGGGGGASWLL